MKQFYALILLAIPFCIHAQSANISGKLLDNNDESVVYSNVILMSGADSTMVKVETSDFDGNFSFTKVDNGTYYLIASYVGYTDYNSGVFTLDGSDKDFGAIMLSPSSVELETAVITARKSMVEVKPDKTIFNVEGTINSVGSNGLDLLRKAPGVLVDNNDNVSVLGRSGVLMYVDGKRLPLSGDDLKNYLLSLTADQIDRMEIITNPGAKYEAEGNAGIIDIRLKKNENYGYNGTVSAGYSKGQRGRYNLSTSGNYRMNKFNVFANAAYNNGRRLELFDFLDQQNGLSLDRDTDMIMARKGYNVRGGIDYFLSDKHTIGILVNQGNSNNNVTSTSRSTIAPLSAPAEIDSVLVADNTSEGRNRSATYNLNYRYTNEGTSLNVDADYGRYRNTAFFNQPNIYLSPDLTKELTRNIFATDTPVEIDIYTLKLDYEMELLGGKFGTGAKYSQVRTDNSFLFYDIPIQDTVFNDRLSNIFLYDEKVYAGYVSYARSLSDKLNLSTGLRIETTDATGDLQAFRPELQEPKVELDYTDLFPTIGFTYQVNMSDVLGINYGRRINRPDYNVLNPFEFQISELSFSKGNAFLQPEKVNNLEVSYLHQYRYNFKLGYSRTTDQITRLIGADPRDLRASFINWDNLAQQTVISFNISAPIEVRPFWNAYFNITTSHLHNEADYGDGNVIDLKAFSYNIYQQHSFTLPKGFNFEISGWYSGPGIWGGVFEYDSSYSLDFGISKKFLDDKLNVKLSAQDVFNQAFWSGESLFRGLRSQGQGYWDSRRVGINMSYRFGNDKVKSRNRKAGLEDESGRVGESGSGE